MRCSNSVFNVFNLRRTVSSLALVTACVPFVFVASASIAADKQLALPTIEINFDAIENLDSTPAKSSSKSKQLPPSRDPFVSSQQNAAVDIDEETPKPKKKKPKVAVAKPEKKVDVAAKEPVKKTEIAEKKQPDIAKEIVKEIEKKPTPKKAEKKGDDKPKQLASDLPKIDLPSAPSNLPKIEKKPEVRATDIVKDESKAVGFPKPPSPSMNVVSPNMFEFEDEQPVKMPEPPVPPVAVTKVEPPKVEPIVPPAPTPEPVVTKLPEPPAPPVVVTKIEPPKVEPIIPPAPMPEPVVTKLPEPPAPPVVVTKIEPPKVEPVVPPVPMPEPVVTKLPEPPAPPVVVTKVEPPKVEPIVPAPMPEPVPPVEDMVGKPPLLQPMPDAPTPAEEMARAIGTPTEEPAKPNVPPVPAVAPKIEPEIVEAPKTPEVPEVKETEVASIKVPETTPTPASVSAENPDFTVKFISTETELPLAVGEDLRKIADKIKTGGKRVTLKAYASESADQSTSARRVSLSRVLAVRAFLIENGVKGIDINVRAEGNKSQGGAPDRVDVFLEETKK